MITLKINNKETSVADGTLIVEAAKCMGIETPHFCYHSKLSISGSCQMCLVEVEWPCAISTDYSFLNNGLRRPTVISVSVSGNNPSWVRG